MTTLTRDQIIDAGGVVQDGQLSMLSDNQLVFLINLFLKLFNRDGGVCLFLIVNHDAVLPT